jgi:hypothetical protein
VDLGREVGCVAVREIVRPKPDDAEALVDRAIEQNMVIGHVHMAVKSIHAGSTRIVEDTKGAKKKIGPVRSSVIGTLLEPPCNPAPAALLLT